MKQILSKTAFVICLSAASFLILYSCSKQKLSSTDELNANQTIFSSTENSITGLEINPFKPTVGAPITVETGNQWIENYNKTNRGIGKNYVISSSDLQAILQNTSCVGICLYFAIDENNNVHILPVGINTSGRAMKTNFINTQRGMIDWETAQKWIANDPSPIDARFFGRNTFARLFKDPKCLSIRATYALDEQNKPQLLLANGDVDYMRATSTSLLRYEDASAVCPPICPVAN